MADGTMLLQFVLQAWSRDTKAETSVKVLNARIEGEQRALRTQQKEERVRALLGRLALEGQQIQVVVWKAWHAGIQDLHAQRAKKEERAKNVTSKFAAEGNVLLQLILQIW